MADGAASFRQGFSGPALLRIPISIKSVCLQDYHLLWLRVPKHIRLRIQSIILVLQPRPGRNLTGLGYSPFARHYLGNHYCFLFLRILRCFSSPRSPSITGIPHTGWVAPFGNLRILGCLRLPEAFRSLPRPSSPPDA